MYNIGIISSHDGGSMNTYKKALEKINSVVHYLNDASKETIGLENLDALIIEETKEKAHPQIGMTCDSLIKVREKTSALIWVLSENTNKVNRIVYMKLGADGIIDNQMDMDEFSLLVHVNLKRYVKNKEEAVEKTDSFFTDTEGQKDLKLIPSNFSVLIEGKNEIILTRLEFKTLELLKKHPNKALTYEEIYTNVWKGEFEDKQDKNKQYRVSNLIFHLRKKIEKAPTQPKYIKTVRSKGYMLVTTK